MLFYNSYHSFTAKGVENSPLEHVTEHPKNESSFQNEQVVIFKSPMVIFQHFLCLIFSFLLQKKHGGNCLYSAGYLRW